MCIRNCNLHGRVLRQIYLIYFVYQKDGNYELSNTNHKLEGILPI